MKTTITKLAICMMLFMFSMQGLLNAQTIYTINIGGVSRQYCLYLPSGLPAGAPLVIYFPGYTGNIQTDYNGFKFNQVADTFKFAMCYAQDAGSPSSWNCYAPVSKTPNDTGFIRQLARYLQTTYNLSVTNTFCTGASNGGDMVSLMSFAEQNVFKAVALMEGCTCYGDRTSYPTPKPMPYMMIHATNDGTTYWAGDPNWPYYGVMNNIKWWCNINGCKDSIVSPTFSTADPANPLTVIKYGGGTAPVWLYKVTGGCHCFPSGGSGYFNGAHAIWKFFQQNLAISTEVATIEDNTQVQVNVFPNPVNGGELSIVGDADLTEVGVFNLMGQKIDQILVNNTTAKLNTTSYSKGIYLLKISTKDGIINKRIVVE